MTNKYRVVARDEFGHVEATWECDTYSEAKTRANFYQDFYGFKSSIEETAVDES